MASVTPSTSGHRVGENRVATPACQVVKWLKYTPVPPTPAATCPRRSGPYGSPAGKLQSTPFLKRNSLTAIGVEEQQWKRLQSKEFFKLTWHHFCLLTLVNRKRKDTH
ncbi:unnamed protein product [Caretta caretta]